MGRLTRVGGVTYVDGKTYATTKAAFHADDLSFFISAGSSGRLTIGCRARKWDGNRIRVVELRQLKDVLQQWEHSRLAMRLSHSSPP